MHADFPYWKLSAFYFCYFLFIGAFSPYWSLYLQSLQFSALEIGILMSLLQVMRTFGPNLWGWIADHYEKPILVVQLTVIASLICYLGVFITSKFWGLFLVMSLLSFFWSASLPLVEATTMSLLGKNTLRYSHVRVWGSLGFMVSVIAIGYVLDRTHTGNIVWLVLGTLICIVISGFPLPKTEKISLGSEHVSLWVILKRPEVIAIVSACFLMAAAHGPYYTFFSIYLSDHGYSNANIGWLWAVGVISEIVLFIFMPRMFSRYSLRNILLVCFFLAIIRFLLIAWGIEYLSIVLIAQVLHAATFGAYHAAAVAAIHSLFPQKYGARGQAIYTSLSFGLGGTLGGLYSGFAWENLGPQITFVIASLCSLAAFFIIAARFKPTHTHISG